jgi:hypothetical protein
VEENILRNTKIEKKNDFLIGQILADAIRKEKKTKLDGK